MTILHIITRLIVGGAQQNTIACCAAQVRAGHRVVLAYGPIYGPEGSLLEEAERSGAELVEVRPMRRAILPVHDFLCYCDLRRLIRRVRPDVVHTHSSKAGIVGRAAAWAELMDPLGSGEDPHPSPLPQKGEGVQSRTTSSARRPGRPAVIHTIHGLPFHDRQPAPVRKMYVALERWAARRCDKLIGITEAMCDAFRAEGIGRPGQFEVVPSGVDVEAFDPPPGTRERVRRELGIPADAPVVGELARLDKLKGQDDLLDILPRLSARRPDLRLMFVGDGWTRPHLEERARREGLSERVIFTGLVPPPRVPELLAAMDVNTLPSYQEGQARTLVQALLAGCAVVGYDAGGIPEVCIDGRTGRLAPVGDRDALAAAIEWMLDRPDERRRLTEQGKAHVRERFDARVMIERLEAIYRATLDSAAASR